MSTTERKILDVGCGTGTMLGLLGQWGTVTGIDSDQAAVDFCREQGFERVSQVSDVPLPFEDASFDVVTAFDVLEHIDDDRAMLAEIARVLRPRGVFLATVPAYRALWGAQDEISHHKRRYARAEMHSLIGSAGLRLERLSSFNTLLFPPIAAVRLWRRLVPAKGPLRSDFEMTQPGRLNSALARVFGSESAILARVNLPFGVSIMALASRGE